uniref:Uncharacterized protein n=1 Tax=Meloidogyne enterolobii TaxID=390850 RepID=A0A6V7W2M1_MELEN|nr:unnamed protein product [Meloidogyne enterolobii]
MHFLIQTHFPLTPFRQIIFICSFVIPKTGRVVPTTAKLVTITRIFIAKILFLPYFDEM